MQLRFPSSGRSLSVASAYRQVVDSYPKSNHRMLLVYGVERLAVLRPRGRVDDGVET